MDKIFDVCVVGSGPAGAFLAAELARCGRTIALVEAGGHEVNADPSNVVDVDGSNISGVINFGFSQQIGGSSNLWAGGLARFYSIDLIKRKEYGFQGWPISLDELNNLYERVKKYLDIQVGDIVSGDFKSKLSQIEGGSNLEAREMILLNPPFCTKKIVEHTPNISLFEMSLVHKMDYCEAGKVVTSIEIHDRKSGAKRQIRSKKFVLAAGTLTNVRLLLHSFKDIRQNIPDLYDNVGRYFSTHPKGNIGTLKLTKSLESNHPFLSVDRFLIHSRKFQFGLNQEVLEANYLLNHCLRFDSGINQRLNSVFERTKLLIGLVPWVGNSSSIYSTMIANAGVSVYRAINSVGSFGRPVKHLSVRAFMDQAAWPHNRIVLSNKLSESGLPLASINWKFNDDDWDNFERFVKLYALELEQCGIGKLDYIRPKEKNFVGIHSHFLGGTRIGKYSTDSVVDMNLKLHYFDNLYIAGPSVFPSFGYTNPFYTIAALSLRLADHLHLKLK